MPVGARRREMHLRTFATSVPVTVDTAKNAERQWHDIFYRNHARAAYPDTAAEFREKFRRVELTPFSEGGWSWWADPRVEVLQSLGDIRNLRVLDYGCGSGTLGMYLSLCGAQVSGFDLSGEAIRVANEMARRYGLSAQFEQADAEDLRYGDDFFDLVIGFGVLHHVIKYPRASSQLRRILKPRAKAIFVETLWDNPAINLVRRFTTEDEEAGDAHLTQANIREFAQYFGECRLEKRHLLYMLKRLAKLPERNMADPIKPRPFWLLVKRLDDLLLGFRPLRQYCGEVTIYLQK
jgi:2-polyprenyl-3-methyl-5-hydroxy-6-metoxy-1,4-benzoquinol methylase